jgi:hypothetical protein
MANSSSEESRSLGFCTVRMHSEHGYFGGYLILNNHARPLEFQCTMPLRPSRAQEILYGSTLADFVCGEQIARALTSKAKLKPALILTDCSAVLSLARVSDQLVTCLAPQAEDKLGGASIPATAPERLHRISLAGLTAAVLVDQSHMAPRLSETWQQLDIAFDIYEPFQRIAEALLEAHPIMKAA